MTTKKIKRTPCEIYSRIVGYLRPVSQWNDAKVSEYKSRVNFSLDKTNEIRKSQQNKNGKQSKRGKEK